MHGFTLLLVDRLVGPGGKMEQLTENVLQGMLDGLANSIPTVPEGVLGGTSACLMKHPKLRDR